MASRRRRQYDVIPTEDVEVLDENRQWCPGVLRAWKRDENRWLALVYLERRCGATATQWVERDRLRTKR